MKQRARARPVVTHSTHTYKSATAHAQPARTAEALIVSTEYVPPGPLSCAIIELIPICKPCLVRQRSLQLKLVLRSSSSYAYLSTSVSMLYSRLLKRHRAQKLPTEFDHDTVLCLMQDWLGHSYICVPSTSGGNTTRAKANVTTQNRSSKASALDQHANVTF